MRYEVNVIFINKAEDPFDPTKGELIQGEKEEKSRLCAVSDLTTERKVELFGRVDERALSIHYRGSFLPARLVKVEKEDFAGTYKVITVRKMRNKHSLVVKELR